MIRDFYVILLFIAFSVQLGCAQSALDQLLNLNIKQQPLESALFILIDEANIDLSFSNDIIPDKKITLSVRNQPLKNVLDLLLRDTEVQYRLIGSQIVLYKKSKKKKERFTISGFVEDIETGERLIGVSIYDTYSQSGTTTNAYGFYSLTLRSDKIALKYSYLGYLLQGYNSELTDDQRVNIRLKKTVTQLETIVIASDSSESEIGTSVHNIDEKALNNLPGFGGERDIIRSIHLLPGIQTGTDGIGGLSVRGGSPDENLILIDDVPVYNFTHAAGLYSIINSDAVQKATLYKSEFPARYNGRLSSILDIRTKDGNKNELKGSAGINLLGFKGTLEGPIITGKSSFFISARRSFVNWYLSPRAQNEKERNGLDGDTTYDFQDLNFKLNHAFSPNNRLFLSVYRGKDNYSNTNSFDGAIQSFDPNVDAFVSYKDIYNLDWYNTTASLRWNSILGNKIFANTTLIYSNFDVRNHFLEEETYTFTWKRTDESRPLERIGGSSFNSSIRDYGAKIDLNYLPDPNHNIKLGAYYTNHAFQPGSLTINRSTYYLIDDDQFNVDSREDVDEYGAYLEDEIQFNDDLILNAGLTYVNWQINDKQYLSLQPRLALAWKMDDVLALKVGYSRMEQFIHRLFQTSLGLPSDLWVPSTESIGPRNADIFSAGLDFYLQNKINLSFGAYYKKLNDLIDYSEGANFLNDWDKNVTIGQGNTYGLEFLLTQNLPKTSLQLSYTLSFANRQFDNINFGRTYPFRFDRRHNASFNLNHRFNKWLDFSASWVYNTGFAFTIPRQQYQVVIRNVGESFVEVVSPIDYGEKNDFRMPDYHRLDLNLRAQWKTKDLSHSFGFGVYNAYDRKNPLYYQLEKEPRIIENELIINNRFVEAWLIPIAPHFDYSIKF